MDEKLVAVDININFCTITTENKEIIKKEFNSLSEDNQDPINNWLKLAKAKGNISDSENVILNLVVELHRKLDRIENIIENKNKNHIELKNNNQVSHMGHENFKLKDNSIIDGELYGRLNMPVFPKRHIPLFFSHQENGVYKIDFMHNRDIIDYDSYIKARERAIIRELKGYSE